MATSQNPDFTKRSVKAKREKPPAKRYFEALVELANSVSEEELAKIPHDGSINYRHYLYGHPKIA